MDKIQNIMTVHKDQQPIYDIGFYKDFSMLAKMCAPLKLTDRKVCIVSDSHVAEHYLDEIREIFAREASKVTTFVFEAGEQNKNLAVVQKLYEHLILEHFERRDLLVALGGGVVGDLTGYTAATYLRGIDFIQIPTSLLAQVDSSIGGKTGVDFDSYKNMVGAFHQPKLVYINIATLKTLSQRQFLSGMGEVVKYGIIMDAPFFDWIMEQYDSILAMEPDTLLYMIQRSCDSKRQVVEEDPTEKGRRALLNFGHTLGHAIEKLTNFQYLHGECVFVGSVLAARLAVQKGLCSVEQLKRIEQTLELFQCPDIRDFDANEVIETVHSDKKMSAGRIRFALLDDIGHAFISQDVSDEDMLKVVEEYLQ